MECKEREREKEGKRRIHNTESGGRQKEDKMQKTEKERRGTLEEALIGNKVLIGC